MANNIDIRFNGSANLRGVESSVAALRKQIQALNASANELGAAIGGGGLSQKQIVDQYRAQERYGKQVRANFEDGIRATKQYRVEQMQVETQTAKLSKAIDRQKVSFKDLINERRAMSNVVKEQMRLEQMQVVQWGRANKGKMDVTTVVPEELTSQLNKNKVAWGVWNQAVQSASHQLVNWGKNTQWAGRQMTVGLTMPLVLGAAAIGKLAYEVDKGMTRIGKVYDYAAKGGRELVRETETLNQNILNMATSLSKNYGMALKDTLSMTEKFAATGLKGTELLGTTKETARGAFLGDLSEDSAVELATTLKTVWGVTNDELKQAFDYMNAIENSTSLSMADFTEGVPKIAGIIKVLGGDLKDAGALLVAMKAQGIDAAEGATAIKSGLFKAVAADAKTIEMFNTATGASYDNLRKSNTDMATGQLDFIGFLSAVGKEIRAIDPAAQVAVAKKLFGIHQGSKLLGILSQMADTGGQFSKAMETGQKSMVDLANIADQETAKLQASTSGRLKILVESIKTQFAIAGEALLEPLIPVLQVVEKLLMWFNGLGDGAKKFIAIGAVITAIIGPAVMFVGIMGNMVGTTIGLISKLLTLGSTFKMASAEERAAAMIAREAAIGFNTEAVAAQALKTQIDYLTKSIQTMTQANMLASGSMSVPTVGKHAGAYNADLDLTPGGGVGEAKRAKGMDGAAGAAEKIADESERTSGFWGKIGLAALSVGGVVGSFSMMKDSSASMAENIAGISLALLSLAPILSAFRGFNPFKAMNGASLKEKMGGVMDTIKNSMGGVNATITKGVDANATKLGRTTGIFKNIASIALRTFGPVGILAGGALVAYKIWSHLRQIKKEQEAINQSAKTWSEIIGFSYQQQSAMGTDAQTSIIDKRVEELQKKNEALFKLIQNSRGDDAIANLAISEAVKAAEAGANATEALQVAQTVIYAGVQDAIKRTELMQRVQISVDWTQPAAVIKASAEDQVRQYVEATNNAMKRSKIESIMDGFTGDPIGGKAEEQAKGVAQRFVAAFFTETDKAKRHTMYQKQLSEMLVPSDSMVAEMKKKYGAAVAGITDLKEFLPDVTVGRMATVVSKEDQDKIRAQIEMERQLTQEIAKGLGVGDDQREQLNKINDLRNYMFRNGKDQGLQGMMSLTQAQESYNESLYENSMRGGKMNAQQKLQILNHYRLAAGLKEATSLEQGFSATAVPSQNKAAAAVKKTAGAYKELTDEQKKANKEGYETAIANTMNSAFDYADQQFEGNMDAAMDRVQQRGEARLDAFDKRTENAQRAMEKRHESEELALEKRQDATLLRFEQRKESIEARLEQRKRASEANFEKREESLDNQNDLKKKNFDRGWDRRMDAEEAKWERRKEVENKIFDNRIKRIDSAVAAEERAIEVQQKAIEAEQRAEEIRQRIFAAEKTRIERLTEMANQRIDFNTALNSGSLDEAAKIFSSMGATQESWAIDDSADQSSDNSEASIAERQKKIGLAESRQETLNKEKDAIEQARDARLKALEATETAEKKALEARKLREQDALEASISATKKRLDNEKAAAALRLETERNTLTARMEAERRNLDTRLGNERRNFDDRRTSEKYSFDQRNENNRAHIERQVKREADAAEAGWKARKLQMDLELAVLKAAVPKNEKELATHIERVETAYGKYGVNLKTKGSQWGSYIKSVLSSNIAAAAASINGVDWGGFGMNVANQISRGAFGMSLAEFNQWISTGKLPAGGLKAEGSSKKPAKSASAQRAEARGRTPDTFHAGGRVTMGGGSGRIGYSANAARHPSEVDTRLRVGEVVTSVDKVKKYGDVLNAIHNDSLNSRGGMGGAEANYPMGNAISAMMGMAMTAMMRGTATKAMDSANQRAQAAAQAMVQGLDGSFTVGAAGVYGGRQLTGEQLANAQTIMNVGRSLGATNRDLTIALMTAMQESTLRNISYGDRDSVGLFQQRNAWGSFADRTNPEKSARMFFLGGQQGQRGLFDFPGRHTMPLTAAAQAVQVSAFPEAYAKWESMAEAIVTGAKLNGATGVTPGSATITPGGWTKPIRSYRVGTRYGGYPGHTGQDFPAPTGTPVFAASSGRVTQSKDLIGPGGGYRSYGRMIVVQHANGLSTLYAHNSARHVNTGQMVTAGQHIASVGSTGNSTGPHLHFELKRNGRPTEPLSALRQLGVPSMRVGGDVRFDNTLANLHRDETVLTKPLSQSLRDGIENLDTKGGSGVQLLGDVLINLPDSVSSMDIPQLAKHIKKEFEKEVDNIGRPKKIGGK